MSETVSGNFEEVDLDEILKERNNEDDSPTTLETEDEILVEKIDIELDKKEFDEKSDIEKSKKKLGKDNSKYITNEYLAEIIKDFLTHHKRNIFSKSKKTKDIVEQEVIWYEHLTKKVFTKKSPYIVVNFKDLIDYRSKILDKESISKLIYKLTNDPYTIRDIFLKCIKEIYIKFYSQEMEDNFVCLEQYRMIQVGFNNFQDKPVQLNTLRTQSLSKYVTVEGVISQYDETPRVKILESTWKCSSCNREYVQKGSKHPAKCLEKDCASRSFENILPRQKSDDYFDIQLTQQFGGIQKNTTVSRYVRVCGTALVNYVLNNVSPGQIVVINGVVVLADKPPGKDQDDSGDIELDAFTIEQKNNINVFDYDERLLNIVKDYINEKNINLHFEKLKRSICAHIYKQEVLKEATLLLLVGTNPRMRPDGTRIKGDINLMIVGNSGIGKSDYGVYIQMVSPHSMKAGTKGGTSAAGLTSFVDRNPKTGKAIISLGVLAMVDRKGVAIVEEINRRDKKDLYEFANATDDNQQIYVNKGGFHSVIYSRCPIYATANSLINNGDWDESKTVTEQTRIDRFIISRMDFVFLSHIERTKEYKDKLMTHMEKEYDKSVLEKDYENAIEGKNNLKRTEEVLRGVEVSLRQNDFTGIYPIEYMRHELFYLKSAIDCKLVQGSEAYNVLRKFWTEFSSMNSLTQMSYATDDPVGKTVESSAMDIRKFTSLVKISEAYGRIHRRTYVTVEDAQKACDIMAISLASQIPQVNMTSLEEQNEYAKKMMERNSIKRMADSMSREKQILAKRTYEKVKVQLKRFNDTLYRCGYDTCKKCHGTGIYSEIVDSENKKLEKMNCGECEGKGGFDKGFTYNDFESVILNNNIMKATTCLQYFTMYRNKKFIYSKNDIFYHNINLKSPDTIDAIENIASSVTDSYMEKVAKDEEIKIMNKNVKAIRPTMVRGDDNYGQQQEELDGY